MRKRLVRAFRVLAATAALALLSAAPATEGGGGLRTVATGRLAAAPSRPAAATGRVAPATGRAATAMSAGASVGVPHSPRGGSCAAFRGAYQLPGADGVAPAAYSGGGLIVPACGPLPGTGGDATRVDPYPGAPWTPGYQCVEFAERYLYARYGITMPIPTNGDQVASHYALSFAALFMLIRNGTPHHAPRKGDVLSLSTSRNFDSAAGGHSAVVQASHVGSAGNGTLTLVEENASSTGIQVIPVTHWDAAYPGFPYIEWLTPTRQP